MSASIKAARASVEGRPSPGVPRGDPGFFSGLAGAFKGGFKGLTGGPAGVLTGAASGFKEGFGKAPVVTRGIGTFPRLPDPIRMAIQQVPQTIEPAPGIRAALERALPFGKTGLQVATNGVNGVGPKGFHLNKSSYFLKDGTFIDKGTMFVKNRRRNPLNPRALRNAIGRVDAGKIWQGKLNEITTAKFTSAGNRKAC